MPWVRFDDQFPIHRKAAGLSDAAFRLHVSAIFWCARNLTDGFVSQEDLDDVSARVRTPARFAAECVKRECWHDARYSCESPKCAAPIDMDGWVIHDYLEYQPSRQQVIADRKAAAKRQAKWRESKKGNGVSNRGTNAVTRNAVSNATVTPFVTGTPPRPEGSGARGRPERPDGRANPPGPPSGRQDSKSVAEALRTGTEPGHRASPDAYERGPEMARKLLAGRRKPP